MSKECVGEQADLTAAVFVKPVFANSPAFQSVLQLWRQNSQTLGHLPRGAFEERAELQQLLGLFLQNKLVGYLLYRVSKGSLPRATIVHLCLEKSTRGKNLASHLLGDLKRRCSSLVGIGLQCRDAEYLTKVEAAVPDARK